MKATFRVMLTLSLAFVLLASGCNASAAQTAEPTIDMDALRAEIVSTVVAQITADAPKASPTTAPTATMAVTATSNLPTATLPTPTGVKPLSTFTAAAVTTRYPTWTPTPYTDRATLSYQKLADGFVFSPGEDFDQKWVIKNQGFRAWNGDFYAHYRSGVEGSYENVMLPATNQGGEVTIVVDFVAPKTPGHYATNWGLINDDGVTFFRFNFAFYVE